MPKLWASTIETHRHEVRSAVVGAAARLVDERGLTGVTMSGIAKRAGIGRATLYKYFPDVEAVLAAWHDDHVAGQVDRLAAVAAEPGAATDRLRRVLETLVESRRRPQDHTGAADLAASLRARGDGGHTSDGLRRLVAGLIEEAVAAGGVRADVPPDELAAFALAALGADPGADPGGDASAAARLVSVTFDALTARPAHAGRP